MNNYIIMKPNEDQFDDFKVPEAAAYVKMPLVEFLKRNSPR